MSRSNEWGETLDQTVERSRLQKGLLVYSMVAGEEIEIGISGHVAEGIEVTESRIVRARSLGQPTGALDILDDTAKDENWRNKAICLGSFAYNVGIIEFERAGLLRGFIGLHQGVVVDQAARHFFELDAQVEYLPAQYLSLSLEGLEIF